MLILLKHKAMIKFNQAIDFQIQTAQMAVLENISSHTLQLVKKLIDFNENFLY